MAVAAVVFLVLLALGMPVAFSIGIAGLAFFLMDSTVPMSIMVQNVVSPGQSYTMLALPMFIFAGNLMNTTGITSRMVGLANVVTGHMYGSLGQVSAVLSTMMGGISGSANADAAMQSRILGPSMVKQGYSRGFAAAVNGVTGLITATIPPSMGLIVFGAVGNVSIGRLFAAGVVPGILMAIMLMVIIRWIAKRRNYMPISESRAPVREVGKAIPPALWALIFPVILIAGIRFGVFTPSESGAFACMYAIFVGVVIYRELTWTKFVETLRNTVKDSGIIMFLVAVSGTIAYGVTYERVPQSLSGALTDLTTNPVFTVVLVILLLLVAGMFLETTVLGILLTPILLPVVTAVGIDPVQFGVIMMTIVTMGIMTPPVGIALYTTSSILGTSPESVAKEAIPLLAAPVGLVALMALFPQITLFLPDLIFGQ